jgi:carboxyl-terminal processing protease
MFKKFASVVALLLALFIGAGAQAQTAPAPVISSSAPVKTSADVRRESFDIVWRTVKEKHFDPNLGGVDWDKVREKYEPRLNKIKTDAELYELLQSMLGELHESHFQITPPEWIETEEKGEATGGIRINLRLIDNQATITRVEADSVAAKAGIRAGFIVTKVDDTDAAKIIAEASKHSERPAMGRLYGGRRVMGLIEGQIGTTVHLRYLDDKNQPHDVTLERQKRSGEMVPAFGNFPAQYTEFETKRLAGNIGYIRFNIFVMPLLNRILAAVRDLHDTNGLIIDLRGNPGGFSLMSSRIAGMLETEQASLGVMRMRGAISKFSVYPQENAYTGKVVVLTDTGSASTSEIFAAGLQELGRAVIIGETSLGAALPSVMQKLPTGALFQYAIADFKTPKGVLIEGRGVFPDLEVKMTRSALLAGRDPQLEAAIERIQKTT